MGLPLDTFMTVLVTVEGELEGAGLWGVGGEGERRGGERGEGQMEGGRRGEEGRRGK